MQVWMFSICKAWDVWMRKLLGFGASGHELEKKSVELSESSALFFVFFLLFRNHMAKNLGH